ncbi:MAG: hypothetical protein ACR2PR_05840 [Pseudohongiellaceae bacterium]
MTPRKRFVTAGTNLLRALEHQAEAMQGSYNVLEDLVDREADHLGIEMPNDVVEVGAAISELRSRLAILHHTAAELLAEHGGDEDEGGVIQPLSGGGK